MIENRRKDSGLPNPVLVLPDEPVCVRLMNTIWADRSGVHDSLTTAADLRAWLTDTGLASPGTPVDLGDLDLARRLRDALRRLASTVVGDERPAAVSPLEDLDVAVAEVNRAAQATSSVPVLVHHGHSLDRDTSSTGSEAALTRVALEAIELLTARPRQLRACNAPGCVLYFAKDHPRREWCSPACGNRARAARHYHRHHHSHTR
jgi:predicted RNA-binding Zn ribbon-like protein